MSYFDNNATTPLHPAAREALVQALEQGWANPSSPYRTSAQIRASMEKCRESIASNDLEAKKPSYRALGRALLCQPNRILCRWG